METAAGVSVALSKLEPTHLERRGQAPDHGMQPPELRHFSKTQKRGEHVAALDRKNCSSRGDTRQKLGRYGPGELGSCST